VMKRAYKKPFVIAVIPARKGSKRLPLKNIMLLNGKPLIGYIIETALKIGTISEVIVSTDSDEISDISKKFGASVPFLRPEKYSGDDSTSFHVMKHAINFIENKSGKEVDIVLCLQCTTPTTSETDINNCLELITKDNFDSAVTVFKVDDRPEWCGIINEHNKFVKYFSNKMINKMSGENWYMPSGGVYAAKKSFYLKEKTFFAENCGYVIVPPERNTDIDTIQDFRFAEYILKNYNKTKKDNFTD